MKFEQLHAEDQTDLTVELLRIFCDGKGAPFEQLAAVQDQTALEFWQDICAKVGIYCEPWKGFPAWPTKENFASTPGADRPLPDHWKKLLDQMQVLLGKDKH
jgi:hypothetical protein